MNVYTETVHCENDEGINFVAYVVVDSNGEALFISLDRNERDREASRLRKYD